jgi:hypothetical protein
MDDPAAARLAGQAKIDVGSVIVCPGDRHEIVLPFR